MLLVSAIAWMVVQDINKKTQNEIRVVNEQIAECERNYLVNECHPETRPPALMEYCSEQEACMSRNAEHVVRSSHMLAQMVADALNGLVSGLEPKTILVVLALLFGYSQLPFEPDHLLSGPNRLVFIFNHSFSVGYAKHLKALSMKQEQNQKDKGNLESVHRFKSLSSIQ